jgi:uncharacterized protein YgiM (DUF1202 family)
MKMKFCVMILAATICAGSVLADQSMPPAASTNAPAKKASAKKKTAKKPAAPAPELKTVPLVAGQAVVVANRVNVRSRAGLSGEVIGRMTNGEPVTVIEEVTLKHSKDNEPSAWAKIQLPERTHAWVQNSFIDATNKTVIPKKLNLRGGPGESYGIIGALHQGDAVKEVDVKGDWTEIEAPSAGGYAFMAAQYLSQDPTVMAALAPPTTATVTETPTVATTTTEPVVETPVATNEVPVMTTNEVAAAETTTNEVPAVEEPPPPRIVQREGIVRGTFSIQAPTRFELISPDNQRTINYLHTTSPNLDLSRYKGLHIIVTGEEGLDERWKNTPVITIQRIQVLE